MITILKRCFTKCGGAEKYARLLAKAFTEKGIPITVLTTESEEKDFPYSVINHSIKAKTSFGKIWEFETFCKTYLKENPSAIVFGMDRNRFQTHLRAGSGCHQAYLLHRAHFEPKWKYISHKINPLHKTLLHMEKRSLENPDLERVFTNSHLVKQEILTFYAIDPKKITVIHNGVEWHNWEKHAQKMIFSSTYEFLFLGNNFERKGLRRLLKGLSLLSHRNFHLSVVGYDKREKDFQKLAHSLNVPTTFYGLQNPLSFFQKADCLVIPSYYDPFANVTTEALAMGLFVVSSKTNGGSEILTKKTGAIIEDLHNDESVKAALELALKHPKTLQSAQEIRNSVRYLDFSTNLQIYIDQCLSLISSSA